MDLYAPLSLELDQLEDVRRALRARIAEGLAADGCEIRALPAHLPPPPLGLGGTALVMDLGGTNMRAALVRLGPEGRRVTAGPIWRRLNLNSANGPISREAFFDLQAELVAALSPPPGLPLGYCFSYPARVLPSRDAVLMRWTKGIDIPDVVGTPVGAGLEAALERKGVRVRSVSVLNDTVATILAAALAHEGPDPSRVLGLILGTGTNAALFVDCARAPKFAAAGWRGKMAVNLESGNFTPPHLTLWDDAVDRASNNPGAQRFEKAVSGYYLPYIFSALVPGQPGFVPEAGTEALVKLAEAEGASAKLAQRLLGRAADLTAAALAGALDHYEGDDELGVLAEGSTFWKTPGLSTRVETRLRALLGGSRPFRLMQVEDANLWGSACAALLPC